MSQPLNNLDIIILIILGLSALIALSRGLIKEVLSIIGWVLGSAAVIYLLPVFTPITKEYIANGMIAGVVTSIFILILFMVIWILLTGNIVGKVRSSKLSSVDRVTFDATIGFLNNLLHLLHPFMPFITEELWQQMAERKEGESLMVNSLLLNGTVDEAFIQQFEVVKEAPVVRTYWKKDALSDNSTVWFVTVLTRTVDISW